MAGSRPYRSPSLFRLAEGPAFTRQCPVTATHYAFLYPSWTCTMGQAVISEPGMIWLPRTPPPIPHSLPCHPPPSANQPGWGGVCGTSGQLGARPRPLCEAC